MLIGGLQKFSMIDYPGKLSAIIFTKGCNFRCGYCHNPELADFKCNARGLVSEEEVLGFLKNRKSKLDAVTVTGGEPTLQPDLIDFLRKIKKIGFLIKLDSNGSNPDILEKVIKEGLADYIAMDIKAPLERYKDVVNFSVDPERIKRSIDLIKRSGVDYEFRTTVVKSQLSEDDFEKIGNLIKGSRLYALQKFIPTKTVDPDFLKKETYSDEEFEKMKGIMENFVESCIIR